MAIHSITRYHEEWFGSCMDEARAGKGTLLKRRNQRIQTRLDQLVQSHFNESVQVPILYWTNCSQPHQFLATVIGLAEVPSYFLLEPVQGQQIADHNVESEAMPRG